MSAPWQCPGCRTHYAPSIPSCECQKLGKEPAVTQEQDYMRRMRESANESNRAHQKSLACLGCMFGGCYPHTCLGRESFGYSCQKCLCYDSVQRIHGNMEVCPNTGKP